LDILNSIGHAGCNSLGKAHKVIPTAQQIECKVITFKQLCESYNIEEIKVLKIDTEGHEHLILPQVYEQIALGKLKITDKIIFEYNKLSDNSVLDELTNKFVETLGYTYEYQNDGMWDENVVLTKTN